MRRRRNRRKKILEWYVPTRSAQSLLYRRIGQVSETIQYFGFMCGISLNLSPSEFAAQMTTLQKVLGMLIFKDNILIIIHTPNRNPEEDEREYEVRKRKERRLAVHPSYVESYWN